MLPVSSFENFLCPGSDDGSSSNKSGRWNVSEVYCQQIVESTDVQTHLSIKLSKKNFRGILRAKSVRRTLVIGLIYEPRANKQFDLVFWSWPGSMGHSDSFFLSTDDYINNLHVDANARPQGHLKFIGPAPGHFLLCKSPGAGHTFRYKSPGVPGGGW